MVFKITVISDEVDEFVRVIEIDSEASFLDLQNIILDSANYTKDQITSFFLCNKYWEKEQEVTLIEMDTDSEYDNYTMADTKLYQLLEDEKQKLILVFDIISDRAFFMELTEVIPSKDLKKPKLVQSEGNAPVQILEDSTIDNNVPKSIQQPLIDSADTDYLDDSDNIDGYDIDDLDDLDLDDIDIDIENDFY